MRPSLPTGTILQNRYRLLSILGQGGFGRTYLAEDQGRFNELCAIKELIPAQGDAYALDKSKELFQREAQILYQIQHPQIPQFRASFEQDQRLFLVQDYVEGQTYRALLDQRKTQAQAFSESEVLQLMRQLLPVLAHIHAKGIIHRDIAPDNIILRNRDQLPVLIDFGVVKELATRLQSPGTAPQQTTVGKPGFAPSEQMQTGRAYPNSDLYSLAVTVVVLLTGREPNELYDDMTLTWYWQRWATVSPGFAQVLNRMLGYRPGDRYQSVSEVVQALQSPASSAAQPPLPPIAVPPASEPPPRAPDVSRVPTVAVGRRPQPAGSGSQPQQRSQPSIPAPRSSVWDDPLAVVGIGLGLVALTAIGSWALVRAILTTNQPTPIPTETVTTAPTPKPSVTLSPSPTPSPSEPVNFSQRLDIPPDRSYTVPGTLKANQTVTYIIAGKQGQQLSTTLANEGVLMTVLGPDQQPLGDQAKRVSFWQGTLPYTGDYFIQLSPVKGLTKGNYQLNITIKSPPEPSPTPTVSAAPSPNPTSAAGPERIRLSARTPSTTLTGSAAAAAIKRYVVRAAERQVLKVNVKNGSVAVTIRYDGQPVEDAADVMSWEAELAKTGDYEIDVVAQKPTDFEVDVSVRN